MVSLAKRLSVLIATLALLAWASCSSILRAQLSTSDHLAEPGFWPTQNAAFRNEFLGPGACASCHAAVVATQSRTPMGATAMHATDSDILQSHPTLNFAFDKYRYEIKSSATQDLYTVTDGAHKQFANLLWAFGTGRVGQSYLFKKDDGKFYEARVTYFDTLKTLHFTPDRALTTVKDLDEAMYRPVEASEVRHCFGCHTTAPSIANQLDEQNLIPGVTCEACHGPGADHAAAMKAGAENGRALIFNPARLDPVASVDFCGACHRTWQDVVGNGLIGAGMLNVRFAPYRLENSLCWKEQDARITCVACHDPHKPLVQEAESYDSRCLQCHVQHGAKPTKALPGKACPVATSKCVTCHMPKYSPPTLHSSFTDHWIRVVKPGKPYPD